MAKQDDGLFLLEVLIDKIVFVKSPCFSDKDFRTCVNIECPAVEPLEICDDDPGACVAKSGGPFVKTFNNGKSCLFSLKESDISSAMSKFPVKICVYKSLPCGCLPTKIVMGEATIDMTKEFVEARKKFLEDPSTVSYQALKDSFRITGPDGSETGEIVMFLRISCFGKLIITRFQGSGGPPNLGAGSGSNAIVDRSCNPRKDFQTTQDPCACGAARGVPGGSGGGGGASGGPCTHGAGGGGGVCPPARDPYNSMPCQDPDDPCYCTGPKPPAKEQMVCRNTDQYCLHVPKGTLPNLPLTQELSEDQKMDIKATCMRMDSFPEEDYERMYEYDDRNHIAPIKNNSAHFVNISIDHIKLPSKSYAIAEKYSTTSFSTIRSKRRSVSFSDTIDYDRKSQQSLSSISIDDHSSNENLVGTVFGKHETTVYMTLFDEFCKYRNSETQSTTGTQATASINKCLQVCRKESVSHTAYAPSSIGMNSNYYSSCTMSTLPIHDDRQLERLRYSDVYFFGRKKEEQKPDKLGMGNPGSKTKLHRQGQTSTCPVKSESRTAQTKKGRGASASTCTKQVSIREEKQCPMDKPCPAIVAAVKGDMVATVSHIRLGPREPCPVHGKEPCQGPNCIIASSGQDQAPVKVTTMTNPRRGVFELVIRRITGAPLAKNELMLEWTPPPSRPPSCLQPCPAPCVAPVPCRPSKCKMIICRPSPCKPKGCKKPCGPLPCRSVPCKLCCRLSCTGKPCRSCKPCKPCKPCRPCKPKPCNPCPPPRCCRPCPPPRKIFKRPCPPPRCRPCVKPCKPCVKPCKPCVRPCKPCPPSPCSYCSVCATPPCKPCKPCRPLCRSPPCRPLCRSPPCRPLCQSSPCRPLCQSSPCRPPPCRPPPCRRPCRSPSPCRGCRRCKPCPPSPCRPCKRCRPPSPCRPCGPCPPAICSPCPPSPCTTPCSQPCCKSPCSSPCKSSPCLRPCPVGRKKTRKSKSQPKIKAHRKRISPCCNRSKTCPVVRSRSVPGPCISCCRTPSCPPRKCCSISPCKPPKCCKSSCSSCC